MKIKCISKNVLFLQYASFLQFHFKKIFHPICNFYLYRIQILSFSVPGDLKANAYLWKSPSMKNFPQVNTSINFESLLGYQQKFSDLSESNHMGLD